MRILYSRAPKSRTSPTPLMRRNCCALLKDGVVADVERIVAAIGREHLNHQEKIRRALVHGDANAPNLLR